MAKYPAYLPFFFFWLFLRNYEEFVSLLDWNTLLNSAITGLFVGAGSTIGTWLITRHFLRNLERLEEKIRNGNEKKRLKHEQKQRKRANQKL